MVEGRLLENKKHIVLFMQHKKKHWDQCFWRVTIVKEDIDPKCRVFSDEVGSVRQKCIKTTRGIISGWYLDCIGIYIVSMADVW